MNRLIKLLTFTLIICGVGVSSSFAREYAKNPSPNGGLVENPDGTWSLYDDSTDVPYKVYSPAEYQTMGREISALELEAGTTGETPNPFTIPGLNPVEREASSKLYERIVTSKEYATPGEQQVGEDIAEVMRDDSVLPSITEDLSAFSGGTIALTGGGAFAIGVAIGTGIDQLLGWPSLIETLGGATSPSSETIIDRVWETTWHHHMKFLPGHEKCSELFSVLASAGYVDNLPPTSGECFNVEVFIEEKEHYYNTSTEKYEQKLEGEKSFQHYGTSNYPLNCPLPSSGNLSCAHYFFNEGSAGQVYFYTTVPPGTRLKELAFPSRELNKVPDWQKGVTGTPTEVEKKPKVKELPGKKPATLPLPIPNWVGHEQEHETLPGVHDPGEKPIPDPTLPEIPPVEHDELFTHYKTRVETQGFTTVDEHVLPESLIDTSVGPNEVSSVAPSPGTKASPSTKVDVNVNPEDAPVPGEEGGGSIGGPTLPGFHTPNFGVLCKGFPFGVPCWLWETIESWSAPGVAPEWGIGGWEVSGHKIPDTKFKLSALEPIMEKVRPAILIFATIGIVLLFYQFAKGGGPPSGGAQDSVSSIPQPDEDVYL
jgi:hypothetical protein